MAASRIVPRTTSKHESIAEAILNLTKEHKKVQLMYPDSPGKIDIIARYAINLIKSAPGKEVVIFVPFWGARECFIKTIVHINGAVYYKHENGDYSSIDIKVAERCVIYCDYYSATDIILYYSDIYNTRLYLIGDIVEYCKSHTEVDTLMLCFSNTPNESYQSLLEKEAFKSYNVCIYGK